MKTKYITVGSSTLEVLIGAPGRVKVADRWYVVDLHEATPPAFSLILDGRSFDLLLERDGTSAFLINIEGYQLEVKVEDIDPRIHAMRSGKATGKSSLAHVLAPMPGLVSRIQVAIDEHVDVGHPLCVLEAMKMENEIRSHIRGIVRAIHIKEKTQVERHQELISLDRV